MKDKNAYIDNLLQQYRDGSISARDRHELERMALDDPFLFDSLEGYSISEASLATDAIDRIRSKTLRPAGRIVNIKWISIAAGIVILVGGLFWVNSQLNQSSLDSVSQVVEKEAPQAADTEIDAQMPIVADSADFNGIKVEDLAGNAAPQKIMDENESIEESIVPETIVDSENDVIDETIISESELTIDQTTENNSEVARVEIAQAEPSAAVEKATVNPSSLPTPSEPPRVTIPESPPTSTTPPRVTLSESAPVAQTPTQETLRKKESARSKQGTSSKKDSSDGDDLLKNDPFGDTETIANKRTIKGSVTDNTGEPLIGVSVFIPETDIGATTDIDGSFSIEVDTTINQLEVAYVGYAGLVVDIDTNKTYDIMLDDSDQVLDEVVVTGYASNVNDPQPSYVLPPGGRSTYKALIKRSAQSGCNQTGKVKLKFTVTRYGEVSDFEVKKGLSPECNQRAIDIIKNSGTWDNQFNKDKKVRYTISF